MDDAWDSLIRAERAHVEREKSELIPSKKSSVRAWAERVELFYLSLGKWASTYQAGTLLAGGTGSLLKGEGEKKAEKMGITMRKDF